MAADHMTMGVSCRIAVAMALMDDMKLKTPEHAACMCPLVPLGSF